MSEFLTPTDVFGSPVDTYSTPTLGLEMVGALIMKPPQTADDHSPAFVVPYGALLNRSTYSILWLTAQRLGWVQSEDNWQAAKTLSATGSVSFYSEGTDGTNFRLPDIGESGGFPRVLGSNGLASAGGIETGFDWQIENITGEYNQAGYWNNNSTLNSLLLGAFTLGPIRDTMSGVTFNSGGNRSQIVKFDASRVVKTGKETTPQGFYQKPFIYTGADITTPAAAPSLEQIIMAAMKPKLLWNTDFSSPNVVNQSGFNGDWSSVSVDEQGWDLWRKYDETKIFQVVPEGSYLPNYPHILQYNGVTVWKGNSPANGNWGVIIPNTVNKIDLRAGFIKTPYHPEDPVLLLEHCRAQYEVLATESDSLFGQYSGNAFFTGSIPYKTEKVRTPLGVSVAGFGSGNPYWVHVGRTPFSSPNDTTFQYVSNRGNIRLYQIRVVGGTTPVEGGLYIFERALRITIDSAFKKVDVKDWTNSTTS